MPLAKADRLLLQAWASRLDSSFLMQYLQGQVWKRLVVLGFDKSAHRFVPHLTLVHLKRNEIPVRGEADAGSAAMY